MQDLRYAVRSLTKAPLVTVLAVVSLALGIGANASMFSVVQSTLVQPLPFTNPERLFDAWSTAPTGGRNRVSYPDYLDWKRESRSVAALSAVQWRGLTLGGESEPERVQGAAISAGLFTMLGVVPELGRDIVAADDVPGAAPVVLLTDELWRRRYQADRGIVGRALDVDGRVHTVVGVLPPKVKFPFRQVAYVALAPVAYEHARADRDLELFGRLAPGATVESAREELRAIASRIAATHPENAGRSAHVRPLRDYFAPDEVKLVTLAALGAVTLVLLIACANVANLLLARASSRAREMSLRAALGAGRGRLVRQLLREAMLIGLISVPLGLLLTDLGIRLVNAGIPADDVPYLIGFRVDTPTVVYIVAASLLSSVLFGLAPAWQASRTDLVAALREGGRTGSAGARTRGRNVLVVLQVALALMLLVGASLFMRSFLNLQRASGGFDVAPLMTLRVYVPDDTSQRDGATTRRVADVIRRVERIPGVQAVGASDLIPLDRGGAMSHMLVDGVPSEREHAPRVFFAGVSQHYFDALGVPLVRGRGLTDAEASSRSAVALVNVSFARQFLGGAAPAARGETRLRGAGDLGRLDAVGRRIRLVDPASMPWMTIVGVVPDFMIDEIGSDPETPAVFVAYAHQEAANTGLIVRTRTDPAALTGAMRAAIRDSDPRLAISAAMTMNEIRRRGFWQYELFGWMFSIFGALALLLGLAGVYGVLSYAVSVRTREFGVRFALGASPRDVLRLTVGQGFRLVGAGLVLGLIGAVGVTRVIASLLYNVTPTDPVSYVLVVVLLGAVGLLASYVPARRAASVDPIVALRVE